MKIDSNATAEAKALAEQFSEITTADELVEWAAAMYDRGDLDVCEMLRGTNLQPWDAPDGWTQSEDDGEDFTVTAPDGSQARWSNRERSWLVL